MGITWKSTILAVALLGFVLAVLALGLDHNTSFSAIWAALGSVVGVLTGVIPSYFFKQQADKQSARANVYAEHVPEDRLGAVQTTLAARNLLQ
jgi:hypothetical protein